MIAQQMKWHKYYLKAVVHIMTYVFYTPNWLTLTLKTHFAQFHHKVTCYFLSWGKTSLWHWGWGSYANTEDNQNKYTGSSYIFCYNFQSTVKFETEIFGL